MKSSKNCPFVICICLCSSNTVAVVFEDNPLIVIVAFVGLFCIATANKYVFPFFSFSIVFIGTVELTVTLFFIVGLLSTGASDVILAFIFVNPSTISG